MAVSFSLTLVALICLLWAEAQRSQLGKWFAKPLASTGFLITAYLAGAFHSTYGKYIFAALVLSWLGDILLIPRSQRSFLFGLISFLLGHLAFGVAFAQLGLHSVWLISTAVVVTGIAAVVVWWLRSHVSSEMWIPVISYIVVISSMVILALGSYGVHRIFWIPLGAVLFYLSDLAVARNRFVAPSFYNRLWGLPFYYVAQLILAWSCSLVSI